MNVNALIAGLARFREPEWRVLGLRHQVHVGHEAAEVAGYEGQLEQAFLNLLVYAEQRASASHNKTILLKTSVLANRALLEIDYSPPKAPEFEPDPFAEAASAETGAPGLEVCLGILRNHGGEARMPPFGNMRILKLPLGSLPPSPKSRPKLASCSLLDAGAGRSGSSCAASPQPSWALRDIARFRPLPRARPISQRLHFDAVLWAVRAGSVGFHDRFRASIPSLY